LAAGRIGAGGGGRVVMRVVVFTPPFTTYPSEIGFTLLKPSIAILLRSAIGGLLWVRLDVGKLNRDILGRTSKVESRRLMHFIAVKVVDNNVA
jgi:hypothetical protein